jgi:DNA-binding transcriptional regulator/RsmH inhibitor MraZ
MGSYFELWDKATYEAYDARIKKSMREMPPAELNDITF